MMTNQADEITREREELGDQAQRLADRITLASEVYRLDAMTWRAVVDIYSTWGVAIGHGQEPCDAIAELLDGAVLSIAIHGHRSARDDEWTIDGAVLVFGTGGPHVQIDTRAREVQAWGWFGAARATCPLSSEVCEWLEQLAGIDV